MGNHASHSGERHSKDFSQSSGVQRYEGQPISVRPGPRAFRSQTSEEDHEPLYCDTRSTPKSPEAKEEPIRYRPEGNRKLLPCVIKWTGGGKNVVLSGSFNNWQKLPMVKSEKDFVAIVDLPEGEFQYKFEVDGEWKVNPNDIKITTDEGHENNLIKIEDSHFTELENELLKDPNDVNFSDPFNVTPHSQYRHINEDGTGYGQVIPEFKMSEKVRDPPVLPPHLLQVMLNKDTPVSCEPTLLPEPNHVILNHMYALSIRDGMMVLSTTHRFKKKTVTTLIYRPI